MALRLSFLLSLALTFMILGCGEDYTGRVKVTKMASVGMPGNLLRTSECVDLWQCYARNYIHMDKLGVKWNDGLGRCVLELFEKSCMDTSGQPVRNAAIWKKEQIREYRNILKQMIEYRKQHPIPTPGLRYLFLVSILPTDWAIGFVDNSDTIPYFISLQNRARHYADKIWDVRSDSNRHLIDHGPFISMQMLKMADEFAAIQESSVDYFFELLKIRER